MSVSHTPSTATGYWHQITGYPNRVSRYFYAGRTRTAGESSGSDPTAAGGGKREGSEWQRAGCNAAASTARRTPGTATGHSAPKILNAKAFGIFTFYLFTLHFSLNSHSGFLEVISNSEQWGIFEVLFVESC